MTLLLLLERSFHGKAHKRFSAIFYWCGGGGVVVAVVILFIRILSFFSNQHKGEMPFLLTLSMTTSFRSYNLFLLPLCTLTAVGVMRIYIFSSACMKYASHPHRVEREEALISIDFECLVGICAMKTNLESDDVVCVLGKRKTSDFFHINLTLLFSVYLP